MDEAELLRRRMQAQFGRARVRAAAAAGASGGVQAQDAGAARLALRARGVADPGEPGRALAAGETVVLALMRGTLHLVPAEDARWMLGLFADRNLAAGARRRRELGLTEAVCARARELLPALLEVPRGRAELVRLLNEEGLGIDPKGQAPAHLMGWATAHGLLCRGADVAPREPGYVPLPQGRPVPEDPAAELAGRYLAAFGPAEAADFASWSGLPVREARRAVAAAAPEEVAPGLFAAPGGESPSAGPPVVRLLGAFDNYLLGYRNRDAVLAPEFAKRINAGGGIVKPALVADGRVVGGWRREKGALVVEPFRVLPAAVRLALAEEAAAVAAFLQVDAGLRVEPSGEC
ncbi:winged helix DNA-binding domain-containing protein [Kitasatospora sp. DSM 101779]|uniref:winged helix DNA-binding domain-containing protein n=1 Tax=Kitasatospora sp. DSM 101779 TaxID=2853165 RepID=UPI0021D86454|nr:winged helix DNA-binding domain-containing protein [Kitasatospora sp. DSM 101779]MCU7821940.1 winged helix DNA-binding domain-containing protein [Kitasatospora sp. DSM 101779]